MWPPAGRSQAPSAQTLVYTGRLRWRCLCSAWGSGDGVLRASFSVLASGSSLLGSGSPSFGRITDHASRHITTYTAVMGEVLPFHLARLHEARDLLAHRCVEQVRLDEAARVACLSKFHFERLFREAFGDTPRQFQIQRRLELARKLLTVTDLSVSEVCVEIGYSSLGSFSSQFRRAAGCTPTEFRYARRNQFALGWASPRVLVPSCMVARYAPPITQYSRNDARS